MSEEILKIAKADIDQAETNLETAKDLIDRLKRAGESTAQLESDYAKAQARLRRFKAAFSD